LNPLVDVDVDTAPLASLTDAQLAAFRCVIVCDEPLGSQDKACGVVLSRGCFRDPARARRAHPLVLTDARRTDAAPWLGALVSFNASPRLQVNTARRCHALRVPFIASWSFGFSAVFFVDFGTHSYTP
jgi:hypothetical protein